MGEGPADPNERTITVTNLPPTATWLTLKQHFTMAGRVAYANVFLHRQTGVPERGVVRFEEIEDANRAMAMMGNLPMDGKTLAIMPDQGRDESGRWRSWDIAGGGGKGAGRRDGRRDGRREGGRDGGREPARGSGVQDGELERNPADQTDVPETTAQEHGRIILRRMPTPRFRRRIFFGRGPFWGIGVTSCSSTMLRPVVRSPERAPARPGAKPLTRTTTCLIPLASAFSAAACAVAMAAGPTMRFPPRRYPSWPLESGGITVLPNLSLTTTKVLFIVDVMVK